MLDYETNARPFDVSVLQKRAITYIKLSVSHNDKLITKCRTRERLTGRQCTPVSVTLDEF